MFWFYNMGKEKHAEESMLQVLNLDLFPGLADCHGWGEASMRDPTPTQCVHSNRTLPNTCWVGSQGEFCLPERVLGLWFYPGSPRLPYCF